MRPAGSYQELGFSVRRAVISARHAERLAVGFELAVESMAAELDVGLDRYLSCVCRWATPNVAVDELVAEIGEPMARAAEGVLGRRVEPSRAAVFRKSRHASAGTHGHQDAGYWVQTSSRRYRATTWLALDAATKDSAALRVVPGSHRAGVGPPSDYLRMGFVDPAGAWGERAVTLDLAPGDVVTFHPRLWHASHPCSRGHLRRSLAVRWSGGDDVAVPAWAPSGDFGMYTSGDQLLRALLTLHPGAPDELEGAAAFAVSEGLARLLPRPKLARSALCRLTLYLKAARLHHGSDQRGMVWDAIRDDVVSPILG